MYCQSISDTTGNRIILVSRYLWKGLTSYGGVRTFLIFVLIIYVDHFWQYYGVRLLERPDMTRSREQMGRRK
jgi:hypothetical protein